MSDPLRRAEPSADVVSALRESAEWLVDVLFERSTAAPPAADVPPSLEARSVRLARGRRVACVSLVAGCGTSTLAALLAQRSGGAGGRARLLDLDLVSPSLGVIAGQPGPTVTDALADPSIEGRRWGSVEAIYGGGSALGAEAAESIAALVCRLAAGAAVIADAGILVAPGCTRMLAAFDTVLYVTTMRAVHVHAATRAATLLRDLGIAARLVVVRADAAPASAIAREVSLPLAGAVPDDPFLSRDEFRVRAETARAIDAICVSLRDAG